VWIYIKYRIYIIEASFERLLILKVIFFIYIIKSQGNVAERLEPCIYTVRMPFKIS
jgi:hypothetical protein